ncbi:UNVERIFIED_CONTAM: hypothetical protein FKN15_042577 [Acipenser sinensis]
MDNRNIVDDGRSQKLTRDDIETLKDQGLKGQEIVQQLIENSSTFRDKTEFAQEKYIKKKKKKYDNTITVLKPSTRIMALMYHGREPGKICNLRYDTLAQMLTLGNIHAGSKLIVFETCAGLVLGAVMEQMGGYGSIIQMYPGGEPVRAATDSFGFPEHFYKTLHEFPLCKVNSLLAGTLSLEKDQTETMSAVDESKGARREAPKDCPENRGGGGGRERLVIASRFHPTPLVLSLLKLVGPSRPFVIYCQHVLPNRTHPMLLMSGGGGYISMSTGMTVDMDPAKSLGPQQTEEPAPKRQKLQDTES